MLTCLLLAAAVDSAGPPPAGERTIEVLFAVDAAFRADPRWRDEIVRATDEASRLFSPLLHRRFTVAGTVPWAPREGSAEELLDDLRAQAPPGVGKVVAGLSGVRPLSRDEGGASSYAEGSIVVVGSVSQALWRRLLLHELAHVFGAVHLEGEDGLASPRGSSRELDGLSARLIEAHRGRRFAPHLFPLPPEDLARARALYREAAPRSTEARVHIAQIALEQQDNAAALAAAQAVLARGPGNVEARNLEGVALRRLGRLDEAVASYERALEQRPRYALLHYNLAIAADRLGRVDRAEAAYERAIELHPSHTSALSNLARLQARRGRAERAMALARRALELDPDFAEARVNLAMACLEAGKPALAEAEARRAVEQRPGLSEAHESLGAALLARGMPEEALGPFEAARRLAPEEVRLRRHVAVASLSLFRRRLGEGRAGEALAALRRAAAAEPDDAEVASAVADACFEVGLREEARDAYLRMLKLRPDDGAAHNNLAVVFFRLGDLEGASRHAERAQGLGVAPHPDFLKALAEARR